MLVSVQMVHVLAFQISNFIDRLEAAPFTVSLHGVFNGFDFAHVVHASQCGNKDSKTNQSTSSEYGPVQTA